MKLSTITDAYEYEVDCLIRDCKTMHELETLKLIEAQYLTARRLFDRIIFRTPCGDERNELIDLYTKKDHEFYAAKDEAFQRLTKI